MIKTLHRLRTVFFSPPPPPPPPRTHLTASDRRQPADDVCPAASILVSRPSLGVSGALPFSAHYCANASHPLAPSDTPVTLLAQPWAVGRLISNDPRRPRPWGSPVSLPPKPYPRRNSFPRLRPASLL
ncbi:hypothetical protein GQ602_003072 [Ophiocordyceps camponoti-floridani]|uniref:Uncharacterized protein n=1 Tax=Ophiocordyceps camponoti-floridani TaxID=2030778 RepID=A0A8H4VDU9_9HYPO|nr:hypothetical protein GQ602_003072 [Ophiocordyceps camponoti-floridani]